MEFGTKKLWGKSKDEGIEAQLGFPSQLEGLEDDLWVLGEGAPKVVPPCTYTYVWVV